MSRILGLDATRSAVDGLLHLDTQKAPVGLDLTVGQIFRVTGPGSLDFGGSEMEAAEREALEPRLRNEDDDYGWWELAEGSYVVRYNEALEPSDGQLAQILPLVRLLLAGATHPAFVIDGPRRPLETLLVVGDAGCRLKENCRVSRLILIDLR